MAVDEGGALLALLALLVDEGGERGALLVDALHGFGVALILFLGATVAGALHGADAVPDDGRLDEPDGDVCGGDPQPGVLRGEACRAERKGGGFVLGHWRLPRAGGGIQASSLQCLPVCGLRRLDPHGPGMRRP